MQAMRTQPLHDLLVSMFGAGELRRFLRHGPDGDLLDDLLPGPTASPQALVAGALDVLATRGMVDDRFFRRLIEERPRRREEIVRAEELWRAAGTPTKQGDPGRGPARSRPDKIAYLVAVALGVEQQALVRMLPEVGETTLKDGTVVGRHVLTSPSGQLEIGVVNTGVGNVNAALVVSAAVSEMKPRGIAFVGIAGGLKPEVALGDVVVATKVYGYEYGRDIAGGFRPRPELGNTAYRFQQRAMAEARKPGWLTRAGLDPLDASGPKVHVKPIAAGSVVVADQLSRAARLLSDHYSDAYAVEMEGFGVLRAADQLRTEAVVVRGISDLLHKTPKHDAQWQPRAARNAVAFTLELLANVGR